MTSAHDLHPSTTYTVRYFDLLGHHHEMTATYLGDHKFGGTSWSFRPLPGVKNLAPGGILSVVAQAPGTSPLQPRSPPPGKPVAPGQYRPAPAPGEQAGTYGIGYSWGGRRSMPSSGNGPWTQVRAPDTRSSRTCLQKGVSMTMVSVEPRFDPSPTPVAVGEPPRRLALQRLITTILVLTPVLALGAGLPVLWGHAIYWSDVILAVALYAISGYGMTVGFHRLFAHRSFKATRTLKLFWR